MDKILRKHVNHAKLIQDNIKSLTKQLTAHLKGRDCRVLNKYWNGQQHGRSWPRQFGKTHRIQEAFCWQGEVFLVLRIRGKDCSINITDVEVLS